MYKAAQMQNVEELVIALPIEHVLPQEDSDEDVVFYKDMPTDEEVVEMHAPEEDGEIEISFKLPRLPGASDDVVEVSGDDLEVSTDEKEEEKDKSKANDKEQASLKDCLKTLQDYLSNIPKHKGETIALERAKSYLKRGLDMLSKFVQQDYEGEIDISKAEDCRREMEDGIDRLEKELAKRKKKADQDKNMTKEGSTKVSGIIVTVPIFISRIARVCINGSISGGKDIEDLFHRQAAKWKLTDREKVEVVQLIQDMGYPLPRLDRGFMVDDKDPYQYSSENNFDLPPNYQA